MRLSESLRSNNIARTYWDMMRLSESLRSNDIARTNWNRMRLSESLRSNDIARTYWDRMRLSESLRANDITRTYWDRMRLPKPLGTDRLIIRFAVAPRTNEIIRSYFFRLMHRRVLTDGETSRADKIMRTVFHFTILMLFLIMLFPV
jgi:hypothetical protein